MTRTFFFVGWIWLGLMVRAADVIPVTRPQRSAPVDFRSEILPLLQANCLPCHNKTTTKADLLLETPADMLKGGETGPAIIVGDAAGSLLMKLSTHAEKPRMPPRDNKVNAVDFTPEQLGLLARWIEEGAKAGDGSVEQVRWLPSAPELRASYAVALSADGQFVAAGRGNRLWIYHRPTSQPVGELISPGGGSAQRDVVGSLAFRADGQQLAAGGFREIRLWQRIQPAFQRSSGSLVSAATRGPSAMADGSRLVRSNAPGQLELVSSNGAVIAELKGDSRQVQAVRSAELTVDSAKSGLAVTQRRFEAAEKEQKNQNDRLGRGREARVAALDAVRARYKAQDKASEELKAAEMAVAQLPADAKEEEKKARTTRLEAARKAVDAAKGELETAQRKLAVSEEELRLTDLAVELSRLEIIRWQELRTGASNRLAAVEQERTQRQKELEAAPFPLSWGLSPDGRWWVAQVASDRLTIASGLTGEALETWDAPGPVDDWGWGEGQSVRIRCGDQIFERALLPTWALQGVLGGEAKPGPLVDRVGALGYSPDGRWLASGSGEPSRSGDVSWWDPTSGAWMGTITNLHSDTVLAVSFSPDSQLLASGGADRFARVVDPQSGRALRALEGHTGHVLAVGWKNDSTTLASAGADLTVKFWDTSTGEKRKQAGGFEREVTGVVFLKDDQWLATGHPRELRVVNENGDRVRVLTGLGDLAYSLAISADGRWIVAAGEDGVVRIWDRNTEAPRWQFPPLPPTVAAAAP